MAAIILDGKKYSKEIRLSLKEKVKAFIDESNCTPLLATIMMGDAAASKMYVSMKHKACKEVGISSERREISGNASEEELIGVVDELNNNDDVHGILPQLPLPRHIKTKKILSLLNPLKDVDGFTPTNQSRIASNDEFLVGATPLGIIRLLEKYKIPFEGMNVVIINHSVVVGRPLANLFLNREATVTVCHVNTRNLESHTRNADILVSATGVPHLIKADMVKEDSVLVDVGVSKKDGKLVGDLDYDNLVEKVSYITPVPGGTGPMTIASLLDNTLKAAVIQGNMSK